MIDDRNEHPDEVTALRRRVAELEELVRQRDATIEQCETVIRKLRERVGKGFRGEVLAFSDSIKDLLT
jgi:Zn-finger domain-containing protein